uniref:Striatin 4 n=1 Tax=Sander lucioperca TaxID=283035 RepID=A0A8D0D4R6_SANLU
MEADRSGGGPNPNSGGGGSSSGSGRNPNGPKAAPGQPTSAAATGALAAAVAMAGSSQARELQDGDSGMTLPGILHFIQYEWGRFQAEKYRWEAERDELRAQVAFLQGERKGQENMKQDLVRRIKMLEYALKQESNSKFLLFSFSAVASLLANLFSVVPNGPAESDSEPANQMSWKEGRQLLRKYLEEVGYSDTILDMRSKRVRSLLGRSSPEANGPPPSETCPEPEPRAGGESLLIHGVQDSCQRDLKIILFISAFIYRAMIFCHNFFFTSKPAGGALGFSSDVFIMDAVGGGDMNLGELADLTVANDNDLSMDVITRKTWNPRFTLRSHFDAIRALTFHPSQAVLLTASEDGTLKLWNLNKAMHSKKNAALDVEPIYTFRAHSGAVLSLTMGEDGESCYSGGLDGTVRCWKMPDLNVDPYDNYDPGIESSVLAGHDDSVWGLTYSAVHHRLASCSADGTIRVWDPQNSAPCLSVFNKEKEHGTPTSVAFVATDPNQVVVSFDAGETLLYDLNTEQSITALETQTKDGSELINRVVSHPSEPVSITAHENRTIRFLDNKTGKVVHSMVAHLDAVTCLTTDPKGTYLISGSHDCSVRLWMLDNRTCVQEITAHRKKHDEAIHDVAFHSSQPFIASAGSDALAKIFV